MTFDPVLAEIRFGCGPSPRHAPPGSVAEMMARLRGPDEAAAAMPIPRDDEVRPSLVELRALKRARREAEGAAKEAAEAALQEARDAARDERGRQLRLTFARALVTRDGLRERLTAFWADHFTVVAENGFNRHLVSPFVETAIRPRLTGRFADLLEAVTLHPMMIKYLDQTRSAGPESRFGRRTGRGLNENLARELIELHTIGVDGPYGQDDVRQMAELLTGITYVPEEGVRFRGNRAEPGAETVLGTVYGPEPSLDAIRTALRDIAAHPATARHICRKLAAHFVSDRPDPELAAAMEARWRETGGDLAAVTEAMLSHPAAWAPERRQVRQPVEYVAAALRALDADPAALLALGWGPTAQRLIKPMMQMGQQWQRPPGPDGWPEAPEAWINEQFLAARIDWAMRAPRFFVDTAPDPRALAVAAFGPEPPTEVAFAARAAETRAEGAGLVLASAAFQRR